MGNDKGRKHKNRRQEKKRNSNKDSTDEKNACRHLTPSSRTKMKMTGRTTSSTVHGREIYQIRTELLCNYRNDDGQVIHVRRGTVIEPISNNRRRRQ